jgi:hypothetical protein
MTTLIFDDWPLSVLDAVIDCLGQAHSDLAQAGLDHDGQDFTPVYADIAHLEAELRAARTVAGIRRQA